MTQCVQLIADWPAHVLLSLMLQAVLHLWWGSMLLCAAVVVL